MLTRHVGEALRIGKDIVVRVTGARGQEIRLAIEAPRDVRILREELTGQGAAHERDHG